MELNASDFLQVVAVYCRELLLICLMCGMFLWLKLTKKRKYLPPGPGLMSLLGNFRELGSRAYLVFEKWSRVYGPIIYCKILNIELVVISDYKLMKELLSDHSATGRMLDSPIIYELSKGSYGVLNAEGRTWEEQRPFTIRTLRNLGFSKTSSENLILDEAQAMVKFFKRSNGQPIPGLRIFNAPVINSFWRIVTSERCDWEKTTPEPVKCTELIVNSSTELFVNGLMFVPMLRHIAPEKLGWNKFVQGVEGLTKQIEKALQIHEETFDEDNIRDFIDCFLLEMKLCKNPQSSFYGEEGYKNLTAEIFDLFLAGSETTSETLSWMFLYLSAFPDIQEKVYEEICSKLGSSSPSLSYRAHMPYTEAFIYEVLRKGAVAPLGVPRRMLQDKMFHGYLLPKGSIILANIYAIINDPGFWQDPEAFKPERFLNEDGTKVVRKEALVTFGEGKRKCIGETLAKDTIFLFLISFLREFKIRPENDAVPDLEGTPGIICMPKPFKVKMVSRN